jgi:hypothetical protein
MEALPPATPFTCQATVWFPLPVTVALKACVPPARTLAELGDTDTPAALEPEDELLPAAGEVPPHPACSRVSNSSEISEKRTPASLRVGNVGDVLNKYGQPAHRQQLAQGTYSVQGTEGELRKVSEVLIVLVVEDLLTGAFWEQLWDFHRRQRIPNCPYRQEP